jgi:hypothetical protein
MDKMIEILSFDIGATRPYLRSEVERLDKNLIGIYAVFNDIVDQNNQHYTRWIYWGCGNIYDGLIAFLSNPCNTEYCPDKFSYTTKYGASKTKLTQLKESFGAMCT